jgi:hypothetical protein
VNATTTDIAQFKDRLAREKRSGLVVDLDETLSDSPVAACRP